MIDEKEFQEKLKSLVQELDLKTEYMNEELVKEYFKEAGLSKEQMALVFSYLKKVKKERMEKSREDFLWKDRNPVSEEERKEALVQFCKEPSKEHKELVVEAYTEWILSLAKTMEIEGMGADDLFQEGMMGLLSAMVEETRHLEDGFLQKRIRSQMTMLLDEKKESDSKGRLMVEQVERLKESLDKLEKEYGRQVMLEELAIDMNMSTKEVLDILKLAGELPEGAEELSAEEHNHENQ